MKRAWLGHVNHLNFGGHQPYLWSPDRLRRCQLSSPVSVINFWWSSDNCWSYPPSRSVFRN